LREFVFCTIQKWDVDIFLRLEYHNGMSTPRQHIDYPPSKGASARTRKLMLLTARQLMQAGFSPSVSEVAEEAEVSRSTAYRYFPTKAAMVRAVVGETLGSILEWDSEFEQPEARVVDLISSSFSTIVAHEATFKAALRIELEVSSESDNLAINTQLRGHRIELIERALEGIDASSEKDRLTYSIAVLFGIEALTILKDVCGLDGVQAEGVVTWASKTLTQTTLEQIKGEAKTAALVSDSVSRIRKA
jgi:AcrR family transcriptional regulator